MSEREPVVLEGVAYEMLYSVDPRCRMLAEKSLARNEQKIYGRVTNATTEKLAELEAEVNAYNITNPLPKFKPGTFVRDMELA
jgi:hypothetical protein